jgi:hypothetical protein
MPAHPSPNPRPRNQRPTEIAFDLSGADWTDDDAIDRLAHEIWCLAVAHLTHDAAGPEQTSTKESP